MYLEVKPMPSIKVRQLSFDDGKTHLVTAGLPENGYLMLFLAHGYYF